MNDQNDQETKKQEGIKEGLPPAVIEEGVRVLDGGGLSFLTDSIIEKAGKQIDLRKKLLGLALKAVKPHDFQDFGGKPYLEGEGGAMKTVRKIHSRIEVKTKIWGKNYIVWEYPYGQLSRECLNCNHESQNFY